MGIEDLNGILKNIAADKKQQIRDAIVDGRISEQDAKKIGLSGEEQRALNEAFARGEVLVDDLFVKNLGEEYSDGRAYQLTHTGTRKNIKVEGSPYYAVYELNHNTREATVKFYDAMSKEINVQEFAKATGLDPNGKYGVKDGFLVAINDGEENNDKNDSGQNTLTTLLATTAAGAAAGAIGGSTLMGIGALPGAGVGALGGLVMGIFTSCSPEEPVPHNFKGGDINVDVDSTQYVNVIVQVQLSSGMSLADAVKAIVEAINNAQTNLAAGQKMIAELQQQQLDILKTIVNNQLKQGTKIDDIISLLGSNNNLLKLVLDAVTSGNAELTKIRELLEQNNKDTKDILKVNKDILRVLLEIQKALDKLGQDQAANFVKVINAINNLGSKLPNLEKLLNEILEAVNDGNNRNDANAKLILDAIANLKLNGGNVDLSTITQLLQDIKGMFAKVPNYMAKFDAILAKLDNYGGDIVELLNKILDAIKNHTCNCNCGGNNGGNNNGNHEGILDDINGLIS